MMEAEIREEDVIRYEITNEETLDAVKEVKELEKNPGKRTYSSFQELLEELDNEEDNNEPFSRLMTQS